MLLIMYWNLRKLWTRYCPNKGRLWLTNDLQTSQYPVTKLVVMMALSSASKAYPTCYELSLSAALSQLNNVYILISKYLVVCFNNIFPSISRTTKCFPPLYFLVISQCRNMHLSSFRAIWPAHFTLLQLIILITYAVCSTTLSLSMVQIPCSWSWSQVQ
jgi:hypothetical protein